VVSAVGTPTYVYSAARLTQQYQALRQAFGARRARVCYAVKANATQAVLAHFARRGAGFDIVSGGELYRVLQAGGDPRTVVFSGVGKTDEELAYALDQQILMFNVESADELGRLSAVARARGKRAPAALRVNPDVDARTHPYIATGLKSSKFGVPMDEALGLYRDHRADPGVAWVGLDCHIGSQLLDLSPVREAVERAVALALQLRDLGVVLERLDVGGGLGVGYRDEPGPTPQAFVEAICEASAPVKDLELVIEPGRSLVAAAGALLARVVARKQVDGKPLVVVDAGMNDLLRPALYEAHHEIWPLAEPTGPLQGVDVAGPVCESSDVLGQGRALPALAHGDGVAVLDAGAYGMSMASTYNTRPLPAEVWVEAGGFEVVRAREGWASLLRGEVAAKSANPLK
jgi:diaminopimelate decarboxylase